MTEIVMPQMGESLSEGTLAKWLKKAGEVVEADEPLLEISTDKVDTEIPSPVNGTVVAILVAEGETVPIGTVLATIRTEADTSEETLSQTTAGAPLQAVQPEKAKQTNERSHFRSAHEPILYETRRDRGGTSGGREEAAAATPPSTLSSKPLSPAVRRLAQERGLSHEELEGVVGTGKSGRITKKDLEGHLAAKDSELSPSGPNSLTPPERLVYEPEPQDRLVPLGELRSQIAKNLLWSQQMTAQVTSFTEVNVHRLVEHVKTTGHGFERTEGFPLTLTPFVADACVRTLKEFPIFNASIVSEQIAYRKHVHLGVTLALEQGLLAPVVKRADEMSFLGLARALHEAKERAVRDELGQEDVQGASFTLTTPGLFGGTMGTPMVMPPQVSILALGTVTKKPVVIDDAIAIRPVMMAALSFDHRIIDGMTAYQFIERIRHHIEQYDFS